MHRCVDCGVRDGLIPVAVPVFTQVTADHWTETVRVDWYCRSCSYLRRATDHFTQHFSDIYA